jgi:hypothetical protein
MPPVKSQISYMPLSVNVAYKKIFLISILELLIK